LCRALKVSRASFYRCRNPMGPSPRAVRHQRLVAEVTDLFEKEKGRAGRDRLTLMLNGKGVQVAAPTVGAIRRKQGLRAVRTRAWKQTTVQNPQAKTAPIRNHMPDQDGKRDFTSTAPGSAGTSRICAPARDGLYLATVIDLCTGMIIGWAMADHMRARLCSDALGMARDHGYLAGETMVFHSDYAEKNVKPRLGSLRLWFGGRWPVPRLNVSA
jgi:putative transposase